MTAISLDFLTLPLLAAASLVFFSVLAGVFSARAGFSFLLVFLIVGTLAGVDGPGGLVFDDFRLSFWVGNVALAVILLDGGLRTEFKTFRTGLKPALGLATLGVVICTGITAVAAHYLLALSWPLAPAMRFCALSSTTSCSPTAYTSAPRCSCSHSARPAGGRFAATFQLLTHTHSGLRSVYSETRDCMCRCTQPSRISENSPGSYCLLAALKAPSVASGAAGAAASASPLPRMTVFSPRSRPPAPFFAESAPAESRFMAGVRLRGTSRATSPRVEHLARARELGAHTMFGVITA